MARKNDQVSSHTRACLDAYMIKNDIEDPGYKTYSYENLESWLDYLSLTYKDFLGLVNKYPEYPIKWANDIQANMANHLDALNDKQKKEILKIIKALVPKQTMEALEENKKKPLGVRVTNLIEAAFNEDNFGIKLFSDLGSVNKWKHHRTMVPWLSCPHDFIPAIAARTGMSMHWMLGCKKPVLAKTESTECVMDYFCFLPEEQQKVIEKGLRTSIEAGEISIENR